jgi:hypothetical protein
MFTKSNDGLSRAEIGLCKCARGGIAWQLALFSLNCKICINDLGLLLPWDFGGDRRRNILDVWSPVLFEGSLDM